ncbi:MAG: hypothetical protein ACXV9P_13940 [Acidimicrobiia bacterium]
MKFRLRKVLATALTVACGAGAGLVAIATDPGVASAATPVYYLALGDSLAANAARTPRPTATSTACSSTRPPGFPA